MICMARIFVPHCGLTVPVGNVQENIVFQFVRFVV